MPSKSTSLSLIVLMTKMGKDTGYLPCRRRGLNEITFIKGLAQCQSPNRYAETNSYHCNDQSIAGLQVLLLRTSTALPWGKGTDSLIWPDGQDRLHRAN